MGGSRASGMSTGLNSGAWLLVLSSFHVLLLESWSFSLCENLKEWVGWTFRVLLAQNLVLSKLKGSIQPLKPTLKTHSLPHRLLIPVTCESLLLFYFSVPSLPSFWGFLTSHSCLALFSITPGQSSWQEPKTNQCLIKINLCSDLEQMFSQLGNESRSASIWGL